MAQRIFGALALEHLVLQALVGLGQGLGALGHALFEVIVEMAQGLFGEFALGLIDHKDVEAIDRAIGAEARQVLHQCVPGPAIAMGEMVMKLQALPLSAAAILSARPAYTSAPITSRMLLPYSS